ncbi:hypothetical protein RJ640_012140 [Escallonia rubra]|uniref:Calcium uniporter protein C-terminal domain-containing protein n=1 Tax=Escallonia rubra TaxID=112253 RepID=A0AA88UMG3_9ASTE|nr:hypothetical protein RJ640_012140 [Escallonia rubra]
MAFKRMLIQRLLNASRASSQTLTSCRISSSRSLLISPNPENAAPDPGDDAARRRFLQRRSIYRSSAAVPDFRSPAIGEKLIERLRGMDITRDRIRLDGLVPPVRRSEQGELTVEDARKVLRASQLEALKSKLREITKGYVTYAEFVQICMEACSNEHQGLGFAKILDESGSVIVLGNVVFLRPDQVVKAIHGLMPAPRMDPNDPRRKELEGMEQQKLVIDKKAETLVRRELWAGLGYLVLQTAAFMRLTFWELTWDVMEPICFYVTSLYFMAGYAFFLRTSKEPSFEGLFESRFSSKQKRLMKAHNFDVERYNELRKACFACSSLPESTLSSCDPTSKKSEVGFYEQHN